MNSRLCFLIITFIPSTKSRADDDSASVDALKRNQAELSQMISPYKALAGFKSPDLLPASLDREAPPVIKVHSCMSRPLIIAKSTRKSAESWSSRTQCLARVENARNARITTSERRNRICFAHAPRRFWSTAGQPR